jgi:hypothetical protein
MRAIEDFADLADPRSSGSNQHCENPYGIEQKRHHDSASDGECLLAGPQMTLAIKKP